MIQEGISLVVPPFPDLSSHIPSYPGFSIATTQIENGVQLF